MASLTQLLLNAQAPSHDIRTVAMQVLQKQKLENPPQFLVALAVELSTEAGPKVARQLAGLILKNTLKNATGEEAIAGLWIRVSDLEKTDIRKHSLASLASLDKEVRQSAAQAVAAIAVLDLPAGEWRDLLSVLISNASGENINYRISSLMTLGYILEGLEVGQVSKAVSDEVLTALANNILTDVLPDVKLEAIKALGHALQFASQNFKNESERGHIMKMVLLCCQSNHEGIRLAAFQDLCEIALHYYDYIATHLPELWSVTSEAIRAGEKVGSLALEFWNIVADIEKDRKEHHSPLKSMRNFISTASAALLPLLFEGIQQADEDSDEWSLYKSCGSNLLSVSQLSGNAIVDPCITFIAHNITSQNWKQRNAAMLVIGSILEGPTAQKLAPVISDGFKAVLLLIKDAGQQVRVTTAWTLSRLCEFHFQQILIHPNAAALLNALIEALQDTAKVAAHACTAVVNIVAKGTFASLFTPESFDLLFSALMATAYRLQEGDFTLQTAAFAAAEALVSRSDASFAPHLEAKLEPLLKLLKEAVSKQSSDNTQSYLCSILATLFRKVRPESLTDVYIQAFVEVLLALFQLRVEVFEEGIHAFGALAQAVKSRIAPWLRHIGPSLGFAVGKQDDSSLCKAGTMVIGDLARALEGLIVEYLPDLLPMLIKNLQSAEVSTDIKIQSIGSIGDLAQASKAAFLQFIPQVMVFIETAADSSLQIVKEDDDLFSYLLELREVIMQFYISLLQGLAEAQQADVMLQYIPKVVQYAFLTTHEQYKPTPSIHMNTLGLIGDIAVTYGVKAKSIVCSPATVNYINWQAAGNNPKLKEIARWALGHISSLNSL